MEADWRRCSSRCAVTSERDYPLHVPVTAAILSVGDELVLGQTLDTNSRFLAARLSAIGIATATHRTVADDRTAIASAITDLTGRHDLLLTTGGLGPTLDDLTRQALADVLTPGEPLVEDEAAVAHLTAWFARQRRTPSASNRRLAVRPRTMTTLENPNGTALGLSGTHNGTRIVALPGPPAEMRPMFERLVEPELTRDQGDEILATAEVFCFGLGESAIADRIDDLMHRDRNPSVGTTVGTCICTCRIRARGSRPTVASQIEQTIVDVESRLHPYVYARCDLQGDPAPHSLAEVVGHLLRTRSATVCTAESCTGGLIGAMLTEVAGSSEYYAGGWVTYSNALKASQLNVPGDLIEARGAVNAPVAEAMAIGALKQSQADYAISVTGIAGPAGGTADKPVGTVFIGIGCRDRHGKPVVDVRHLVIPGPRSIVRERTAMAALQLLRFNLIDVSSRELSNSDAGSTGAMRISWEHALADSDAAAPAAPGPAPTERGST